MSPRKIGRWQEPEERPTDQWERSPLPPDGGGTSRHAGRAGGGHRLRAPSHAVRVSAVQAGAVHAFERLRRVTGDLRGMSPGTGTPRWVVVIAVLLPIALVGVACASQDDGPTTAKVARASVSAKVTGTGSLRSITEQNLGFDEGGKIEEVNVSVGEQVTAGQILARIDDFKAQAALRKAQAALDMEEAELAALEDSQKLDATSDDADGAEDVLATIKEQTEQVDKANDKSVEDAEHRVTLARADLRRAQAAHEADAVRCEKSIGGDTRRKPGEVHQPGGLRGELHVPSPVESSACDRARKSEADVADAADGVSNAQAAASRARRKRNLDHAEQQVAIENAKRESRAAKNAAEDVEKTHPRDIEQQEAAVEDARTEVDVANRDIENTLLRAPVDGKVAAINGTVGEYVSGGSGTTPLSPGSRAALPDVSSDRGKGSSSSNSEADRPGGGSFMVLDDISTFQVVVPFEESDAAKVQPNQAVEVSFDSVPGLTRRGTVVSVAPTGTTIQDVTNYYVTIVLNELDPRLKDGQTAQASVIIGKADHVLTVPNAAIQQAGATGVVTVVGADGAQRQVQVQLGMVGDGVTEVLSGLREGQSVVVPDA